MSEVDWFLQAAKLWNRKGKKKLNEVWGSMFKLQKFPTTWFPSNVNLFYWDILLVDNETKDKAYLENLLIGTYCTFLNI